ncbi:MAG: tyrosine-type recombinase/integrase, partial [Candidatus Eisenbacteria bacterium]|nr:tyrosine-type recombinase/integrase [Candidatus Latescibacterota bacterium]MBD3301241.1 tyrosine-type recombinase/integrase [Candidatus Eisenbacteria bacterium]
MIDEEATLEAYLDHLRLERRLSPRTVAAYRADLLQHLRFLGDGAETSWGEITTDRLREDLARLHRGGRNRRSQQRYRSSLRSFYAFLLAQSWIDADPSSDLEGPRVPRRMPHALGIREVRRLLEGCPQEAPLDLRDRAMLEVAYGAGLRASELVGLGVESIDLERRLVRVVGKGGRERIVPLGVPACESVRRYLDRGRAPLRGRKRSGALFLNRRGDALSRMGFFRVLRKRGAGAGLDPRRLHPHLLRHS